MQSSLDLASRNSMRPKVLAATTLASMMPGPLYYCDIGALGGIDNPVIDMLRNQHVIRVIGCEPNEEECQRLRIAHPNDIYLPFIISDEDGERDLYVTRFKACSSCLKPDTEYLATMSYAPLFQIASVSRMPAKRFDSLISSGTVPTPDFVKLDVQGYELAVLKGFGRHLDHVLGVRLETHVRQMYKQQPLFHEILDFMVSRGFLLRDCRLTFPHDYEAVEFEAYFSRHPQRVGQRSVALKLWEVIHDIPPGRSVSTTERGEILWHDLVS